MPAVGIGFPSSSSAPIGQSFSQSGPGLINNVSAQMPRPSLTADLSYVSVGTQSDPILTGARRNSSLTHFPNPDPSEASSEALARDCNPPSSLRDPPPAPPQMETQETQTELEMVLRFAEEIAASDNIHPSTNDPNQTVNGIFKPSPNDASNVSTASQASRPNTSSRKCLFPDGNQSSARAPLHPASRSSAIDDALLVEEDVSASGSEDAEDSVRHSLSHPKTAVRSGGVGGDADDVIAVKEVENLETRLRDSELLNQTLKEELEVLNSLMAAMGDESRITDASTSQADEDPTNVLKEHLTEMRRLR